MNRFLTIVFCAILLACTPEDKPQPQPPFNQEEEKGDNSVENYTPEIPTEEDGYDGTVSTDKGGDDVVEGDAIYWENNEYTNIVNIVYS